MKRPSKVIMPAIARRLRMFGAESRSNVDRIGPSSRSLVRAAMAGLGGLVAAEVGASMIVWARMHTLLPHEARQHLGMKMRQRRAAASGTRPRVNAQRRFPIVLHDGRLQSMLSWGDPRFSHECEIMALLLANHSRQYRRVAYPRSCRCRAVCRH